MALHFARPEAVILLIPIIALVWLIYRDLDQRDPWVKIVDPQLMPAVLTGKASRFPWWLYCAISAFLLLALSGPSITQKTQRIYQNNIGQVFLLDLSQHMSVRDLKPNRIGRSKIVLYDLMKGTPEIQTGMVAYSDDAYTVSPVSRDAHTVSHLIEALSPEIMPADGHNLAAGLARSQALLESAHIPNGRVVVLTASPIDDAALAAAKKIRQQGGQVLVIGVGTTAGGPLVAGQNIAMSQLQPNRLKQLADAGGGTFFEITTQSDTLIAMLKKPLYGDLARQGSGTVLTWVDQGHWFLVLLLPFFACCFRRGWLEALTC